MLSSSKCLQAKHLKESPSKKVNNGREEEKSKVFKTCNCKVPNGSIQCLSKADKTQAEDIRKIQGSRCYPNGSC